MHAGWFDCEWVMDVWNLGGRLGCTLAWKSVLVWVFNTNLMLNHNINCRSSCMWCFRLRGGYEIDDWRVACQHSSTQNNQRIRRIPLILLHITRGLGWVFQGHIQLICRFQLFLIISDRSSPFIFLCISTHDWINFPNDIERLLLRLYLQVPFTHIWSISRNYCSKFFYVCCPEHCIQYGEHTTENYFCGVETLCICWGDAWVIKYVSACGDSHMMRLFFA